ncbi:G-protein coupled receptor Mth2 isoform X2 [Eupeodes corollae]|uniref:G-protein coupled receptor Mth2 isoform X2 n=1 Tax=Eupeodes corollae TaxID=290404 RepID=UPI0024932BA2|nr:G-protein coupled receptor Mth2 isoform X2 [Eupeodes corollae]
MFLFSQRLSMLSFDRLLFLNYQFFVIGILSLLFCLGMRFVSAEPLEIPICCPVGYVLVDINQGIFRSEKYECMPAKNASHIDFRWEFFESEIIHGFRIKTVNKSSVPQCDNQILVKFSEEVNLQPRSCLVKLYGAMYAISCPYKDDKFIYKVSVMRKCCPVDYIYESALKRCIKKNIPLNYYEIFFDHPVVLNDNQLQCKSSQAIVEYNLRYNDFKFYNGYLLIKLLNQRFDIDEFCVEGVVDSSEVAQKTSVASFRNSLRFLVRVCDRESICDRIPCIRKCCEDGQILTKVNRTTMCKRDSTDVSYHSFESFDLSGHFDKPSVFGVVRGLECKKFRLEADPDNTEDIHSISDDDGSIYIPFLKMRLKNTNYCVEKIRNASSGPQKLFTFVCFEDIGKDNLKFSLYSVGCLISCFFYAITLIVYLSISKLRNLPGKILICLVICLFVAYLGIAATQIRQPDDNICFASAFCIYFSLMAAFAWTNVMCFDIWQTFGSQRSNGMNQKHNKKFIFYSLYGWGLPSLATTITICLTKFDILSEHLRPKFGKGRCWFEHTLAKSQLIFFSCPIGVLFMVNLVLFTLTLRYCNKVKREIFRMQSSNTEKPVLRKRFFMDRARFVMNTKLFMVMGITWFLEFVSIIFYDRRKTFFWYLSDSVNVLLGVIVFFIFVFKKRVWLTILIKLGFASRDSLKSNPATTYSTCGTPNLNMNRMRGAESHSSLLSPASAAMRRPS